MTPLTRRLTRRSFLARTFPVRARNDRILVLGQGPPPPAPHFPINHLVDELARHGVDRDPPHDQAEDDERPQPPAVPTEGGVAHELDPWEWLTS
jgi:hypothetical protein